MRRPEHRTRPRQEVAAAPRAALRLLAAISVLLALATVGLAGAWSRAHDEALCWRAAAEDNEIPAGGDCHRALRVAGVTLLP